ncbi:MAG: hypothetical protein AAF490_23250 [Chloroflexota bacterium]
MWRSAGTLILLIAGVMILGCQDVSDGPSVIEVTPSIAADVPTSSPNNVSIEDVEVADETAVPTNPQVPNQVNIEYAFYEEFGLIGAGQNGFMVRELDNMTENTAVAHLSIPAFSMAVYQNTAFVVSCEQNCIRRINLQDPANPLLEEAIYETGHLMPISMLHAGEEFLYAVVHGVEVQIVNEMLALEATIPFTEPVLDILETRMSLNDQRNSRALNLAVAGQGIYGYLIPNNPAQFEAVGFESAPNPAWHQPEPGTINTLLAVENIIYGGAGARGLREYIAWGGYAIGGLWDTNFDYFPGNVIDLAFGDSLIYVLSEDETAQYISVTYFEKTQDDGWNANRWLVDEIVLPAQSAAQIEWHQGHLWGMYPDIQLITGFAPRAEMIARAEDEKENFEAQDVAPAFDAQFVYQGQLGGNPQILAQIDNILYVKNHIDLLIYDVSDLQVPILVNRQQFNGRINEMVVFGETAVLSTLEFESGDIFVLDVSTPIQPVVINQVNGLLHHMAMRDGVLFVISGFYRTSLSFVVLNGAEFEPVEMTEDHPLQQIHQMTAQQIENDSDGLIVPDDESISQFINDFIMIGDLLTVSWYHDPSCLYGDATFPCQSGIVLFDISNLLKPRMIHSQFLGIPADFKSIDSAGILTYSEFAKSGERTLDLTPFILDNLSLANEALTMGAISIGTTQIQDFMTGVSTTAIANKGQWAYIADRDNKLTILDLSSLPVVTKVEQIDLGNSLLELVVQDELMVGRSKNAIFVYDIANPIQPILKQETSYSGTAEPYFVLSERWLVQGGGSQLSIEAISPRDSTESSSLAAIELPGVVHSAPAIYENIVYVLM